jgi:hypothetical protein
MSVPKIDCEFISLTVSKKRRQTLEHATFQLTFAAPEGSEGMAHTTEFHAVEGPCIDFEITSNMPLYKSVCGTKAVTCVISRQEDGAALKRWVLIGKGDAEESVERFKTIMATELRPALAMEDDVCPHCIFSCPCLCGPMKWISDASAHVMTASHHQSAENLPHASEAHMRNALSVRYGLREAMENAIIDISLTKETQISKERAASRKRCGNMFLSHTAACERLLVRRLAAAATPAAPAAFDKALAARIAEATERLKWDCGRVTMQAQTLYRAPRTFHNDAARIKDDGFIKMATRCIREVADVVFGATSNATISVEYEGLLKDAMDKTAEAAGYITASKRHRKATSKAANDDNAAAKAAANAAANDDNAAANDAKDANAAAKDTKAKAKDVKAAAKDAKAAAKDAKAAEAAEAAEVAEAIAMVEAAEATAAATAAAAAAQRLQSRARTCLLFRRIEDVRRAAALLASTRYELRTLARTRNEEECGICLTRFDYHTTIPLTAPCSHMPMCYACCRDYSVKACLCGVDHFDRKLWRAAV